MAFNACYVIKYTIVLNFIYFASYTSACLPPIEDNVCPCNKDDDCQIFTGINTTFKMTYKPECGENGKCINTFSKYGCLSGYSLRMQSRRQRLLICRMRNSKVDSKKQRKVYH